MADTRSDDASRAVQIPRQQGTRQHDPRQHIPRPDDPREPPRPSDPPRRSPRAPRRDGPRHRRPVSRRTLADGFDPRHNSLNAVRLALAMTVVVSHSWAFVRDENDPLGSLTGGLDAGEVAVDGFFLLSGFLITRSALRARSTWRYLWHRFLRIVPGFWVCLIVTALVIGPLLWWLERGTTGGYPWTGSESALTYLLTNALLRMHQFDIGGLNGGGALDGSLHTLFFEALCYVLVGVLGAAGVLGERRRVVLGLAAAGWLLAVVDAVSGADRLTATYTVRFTTIFLVGAVMFLYAERVPLTRALLAGSCLLLALTLAVPAAYLVLAPVPLAYLLLWAGAGQRMERIGTRRDLSYGIYIYSWPLQLLLLEAGVGAGSVAVHVAASLAASGLAAAVSWHLVEAPVLAWKSMPPPSWLRPRLGVDHG